MSKKGSSDNSAQIAAQARADEQQRQATIRDGTARINALFDGTPYTPATSATAASGGRGGGKEDGTAVDSTPFDNGGFTGFNDAFYNGRQQAYLDYALPQLDQQEAEARKKLVFALDRQGQLNSSTRAEREAELQRLTDSNRQGIYANAQGSANDARTNVEAARGDLINMLNTTGDVQGTVSNALSRATAMSQPTQFSPLSSMFDNFTSALGTQANAERVASYSNGAYQPTFNTGLFGRSNSVRNT
jgi:hypothetical protein